MGGRHRIHSRVDHARLGSYLKAIREKLGIKQQDLAAKLQQPQSYISRIESGERELRVLELIDICAVLGIDPEQALKNFE